MSYTKHITKSLPGSSGINRKVEAIDTEIVAISESLSACIEKAQTRFATNVIVHTDNQLSAMILNGGRTKTCRIEIEKIRNIKSDWIKRDKLTHVKAGGAIAQLVPTHMGVTANKEADRLAKAGAQLSLTAQADDTPSYSVI